jgi:hypothetical protein
MSCLPPFFDPYAQPDDWLRENSTMFVFVKRSEVAHHFIYLRGRGEFTRPSWDYKLIDKGIFKDEKLITKLLKAEVIKIVGSSKDRIQFGLPFFSEYSVIEQFRKRNVEVNSSEAKQIWSAFQKSDDCKYWYYTPENAKFIATQDGSYSRIKMKPHR